MTNISILIIVVVFLITKKKKVKITWLATDWDRMEWDGLNGELTGLIRVEPFTDKRKLNAHRIFI